jgi:hypothetical protein
MSYSTFFEIGGHVVESIVDQPARPVVKTPVVVMKEKYGVPKPLGKKAIKEIKEASGVDVNRLVGAGGRAKRVNWALRVAAALALADGPIPVGDAIAAGFLVGYAAYEVGMTVHDVKQGLGY